MAYFIREADVHKERELLLKLLVSNRKRSNFPYDKRYDWLYLSNPYGEATAWIIYNDQSGESVGFTAVFPRKVLVKGKEMVAWNCGDFSINQKFRTLGIALKLRKAVKQYIDSRTIPFLYAHPNDRMVHVHLKAGHREIAKMKRFALLIDVSKVLNANTAQKGAAKILNPVLKGLLKFKFRKVGEYNVNAAKEIDFDERYESIIRQINETVPVVGVRDSIYLNWKYKKHPVLNYQVFNYFENGNLVGYIIFYSDAGVVSLVEVVCGKDFCAGLISTFLNYLLQHGNHVQSVYTIQQEYNPIIPTLINMGFKYRSDATSSVIAYTADHQLENIIYDGENWFMNVGDRDA